jgi:hypothetical protein
MHVQVVTFHLEAMTDREYRGVCDDLAPAFAGLPGLVSKTWLADEATNTYGGVYTWRDRQAMQDFLDGELFQSFGTDPHISDLTSRDFDVLEAPTEVTRGLALTRAER